MLALLLSMAVLPMRVQAGDPTLPTGWTASPLVLPLEPDGFRPVVTSLVVHGPLLAAAGDDHVVRVWRWTDGQLLWSRRAHDGWVRCLGVCENGPWLATGADDGRLRIWDFSNGQLVDTSSEASSPITAICWSKAIDGWVVARFDGTIDLYGAAQRKRLNVWQTAGRDIRALVMLENESRVAIGDGNGQLALYEVPSGQVVASVAGHRGRIRALVTQPACSLLFSGGNHGQLTCWKYEDSRIDVCWTTQLPARVDALLWLENELLVGCSDNLIYRIDPHTGDRIDALKGHCGSITALVQVNRREFVSASFDTTIRVWRPSPTRTEDPKPPSDSAPVEALSSSSSFEQLEKKPR